MNKAPAFQFYAADFLVGVMGMSDEEIGVYIKMLAMQWVKGGLPTDPKAIKTMIGCKRPPSPAVLEKFETDDDGKLRNARLESEREKQTAFRESRAVSGSAGGTKRAERIAAARQKATHTKQEWIELRDYFKGCCICGKTEGICKDHIIPIYQGGSDGIQNLQPLCACCNGAKGPESKDYRPFRAAQIGKQMPSKWVASATEPGKQNVALHSSSSSSSSDKDILSEYPPLTPQGGNEAGGDPELHLGETPPAPPSKPSNVLPDGWKKLSKIERNQMRVQANSKLMVRIGKWFNRRESNLWTIAEALALQAVNPSGNEIEVMEIFYLAEIDKDDDIRRRSLITLLNNWNTDLDRARVFMAENGIKNPEQAA